MEILKCAFVERTLVRITIFLFITWLQNRAPRKPSFISPHLPKAASTTEELLLRSQFSFLGLVLCLAVTYR